MTKSFELVRNALAWVKAAWMISFSALKLPASSLPDIVGEALVAQVLRREHRAEATVVRASRMKPGGVTETLRRMVQDFWTAEAAAGVVEGSDQEWALGLLTAMLLERAEALPDADFWSIHAALPEESLAMSEAARKFYAAVVRSRPDGLKAGSLDLVALEAREWQALYTGTLGDGWTAVRLVEPVVEVRRALAAAKADRFLPDLAGSLNNLSNRQSEVGQRAAALESIGEAVGHYRKLAAANADRFLPDLAGSLNNLSNRQSEVGQRAAALESIGEAVGIRRKLAAANPDRFLPDLAMSLNNLSGVQSEVGQRAAALESIGEAVGIRRKLAAANPDRFLPDLADSLNNLSAMQSGMGQSATALESIREAVKIRRKLAAANADRFLPDLAASLNNLSAMQSGVGLRPAALESIGEAVVIRLKLAAANADRFLPGLAMSHGAWGQVLLEMKPAPAAEKFGEGLGMILPLLIQLPDAHLGLAVSLARDYIGACEKAGIEFDEAVVPALKVIALLMQGREGGGEPSPAAAG